MLRLIFLILIWGCCQKDNSDLIAYKAIHTYAPVSFLVDKNISTQGNYYLFIKQNQIIHSHQLPIYQYYNRNCCYNGLYKTWSSLLPAQRQNTSLILDLYADSQRIHLDTFLHLCENTDNLNQAFINADIKAADYTKKEIAEILKSWDFAQLYTVVKTKPLTQINNVDISPASVIVYFDILADTDSGFIDYLQKLKQIPSQEYNFWQEGFLEQDTFLHNQFWQQTYQRMEAGYNQNNFLTLAVVRSFCSKTIKTDFYKEKYANIYRPYLVYQYQLFEDKNGYLQCKKKILNGFFFFTKQQTPIPLIQKAN